MQLNLMTIEIHALLNFIAKTPVKVLCNKVYVILFTTMRINFISFRAYVFY